MTQEILTHNSTILKEKDLITSIVYMYFGTGLGQLVDHF
jgi:hypothetical protein